MMEVSVSKQLRHFPLEVQFALPTGRCLALVGPTGCGKTTTLRIIAGLETPDQGRVVLDDRALVDRDRRVYLPARARRVGLMFQDYALFPHLSVLRNVLYGMPRLGRSRKQMQDVARDILTRLHLQGLEGFRPRELSGGQQQRAALARALASEPAALLMDEPMSALDATVRRQVRGELKQLLNSLGLQTIIVTHDVVDALTLGDVICVMDQGKIVQTGDRRELLSRPRTPFVAEFLGVNLLNCTAGPGPDGLHAARCGDTTFYTVDEAQGEALLTCNPWDISLSRDAPQGSALNVLRGRVTQITHIGGRTRVMVENGVSLIAEITHVSEERLNLKIGDQIYAAFKASAARVYQ